MCLCIYIYTHYLTFLWSNIYIDLNTYKYIYLSSLIYMCSFMVSPGLSLPRAGITVSRALLLQPGLAWPFRSHRVSCCRPERGFPARRLLESPEPGELSNPPSLVENPAGGIRVWKTQPGGFGCGKPSRGDSGDGSIPAVPEGEAPSCQGRVDRIMAPRPGGTWQQWCVGRGSSTLAMAGAETEQQSFRIPGKSPAQG